MQRNVPGSYIYAVYTLTLKCNTQQLRMSPLTGVSHEAERAIVVPAAHTDSLPKLIECNRRYDANVEFTCADFLATFGLPDSEGVT